MCLQWGLQNGIPWVLGVHVFLVRVEPWMDSFETRAFKVAGVQEYPLILGDSFVCREA